MAKQQNLSKYTHTFSLQNKLARITWNIIYILLFYPFASRIFKRWRIFILRCFNAKISWSAHVYSSAKIWAPWNLEMGDYSTLGPKVDCYNQGEIYIEDNVIVSQKTYLCASSHDITDPKFNLIQKPINIKSNVWIAADSFIGPGVTIGEGAVVGARSSVFKNIEPWTIVGGNPATFLKKRVIKNG